MEDIKEPGQRVLDSGSKQPADTTVIQRRNKCKRKGI